MEKMDGAKNTFVKCSKQSSILHRGSQAPTAFIATALGNDW